MTADAEPYESAEAPQRQRSPHDELLTFRSGGQGYAVDIMSVREIRGWSEPTPLPHAPESMIGMVNLRGTVLPVMDLSLKLGRGPTAKDPRNVIIIIQQGAGVHGLLVEAVSDILHPETEALQEVPKLEDGVDGFSDALFVVEDEMIQVLSLDKLLPPLLMRDIQAL